MLLYFGEFIFPTTGGWKMYLDESLGGIKGFFGEDIYACVCLYVSG